MSVKINAPEVLDKQLAARARKDQYGFVAVGSATDAYIHHEEKYRITGRMLDVFLKYRFPVFISTKTTGIRRDIELLKKIDQQAILPGDLKYKLNRGVILSVSISTTDQLISNRLEPGASTPAERLQLVRELSGIGFLTGVNAIPSLPFISDTDEELEKTIIAAREHGAQYILIGGLTLSGKEASDSKTLYYKFLERHRPELIAKYNDLYRDNYYTPRYYQDKLKERADNLCKKYSIRNRIIE